MLDDECFDKCFDDKEGMTMRAVVVSVPRAARYLTSCSFWTFVNFPG